ncbi:hypothetical protein AQJ23_45260 [Streptomyces antibioticus]|nr:hypothetical protein [Streptomyces antibioticus]KUN16348.1 hypothetical protein AQJ23_45260 [Streptomyces antibioticus]
MVNLQSIAQKLLLIALLFVIGGSIVANLFAWDVKWQIPLIYAVLYVLLSVVVEIRDRQAPTTSTHYRTSDEFFLSFARFVRTAERHVYTSYVRNTPPPSFQSPAAQQYFRAAADWTRRNPGASFHRIIGVPAQEPGKSEMRLWLREHYEEMRDLGNYHARVVTTNSGVDAVNVAIIDDTAVLLLLTADGSFMSGHSLETAEAVNSFRDYYRSWWASAEPLESYAQRTDLMAPGH